MTLNDAAAALAAKQAQEAEERAKPLPRLSKEERDAQYKATRARDLLSAGLERLREGLPPTKAQMPHVQRYMLEHEEKLRQAQQIARSAQADAAYHEQLRFRVATMWNNVCDALRDTAGLVFFGIAGNHGWRGKVGDVTEERRGYATEAEAISAALAWRLEMARKGGISSDD